MLVYFNFLLQSENLLHFWHVLKFFFVLYGRKVTINFCLDFFQTVGAVFESLDALFIGRRKNAGQSTGSPLFGELMFYNQQNVDQFVAQYSSPAAQTEVNKDFLLFLFSHFRFTVGLTYEWHKKGNNYHRSLYPFWK